MNGLSPQIMNEVLPVKSPASYYLRDKNELYSRNPKTVTCWIESVSFMAPKIWSIVPQELNSQSLYSFKNYKEIEIKLPMSVMQNLLATCWFYIINMCGTGIKAFFILLFICYTIDVFYFSFIFFSHWKVDADLETKWLVDLLN